MEFSDPELEFNQSEDAKTSIFMDDDDDELFGKEEEKDEVQ